MARKSPVAIVLFVVIAVPTAILLIAHRFAGYTAGLLVGQELPAGQLLSLNGRPVDTCSWKGKPTLLVLYQSTCHACERELEGLSAVAPSLPEVRVVLLALDAAAPRIQTRFPVFADPSGEFLRKVRKLIVPTLYLLDADSRVIYVRSGQRSPEAEFATLTRLLADAYRGSRPRVQSGRLSE